MKKNIVIVFLLVIALITSFVILNGCGKKEENVIKIGAIIPLTGPVSIFGEWHKNGINLALKDINKQSQYKVNVIFEDSKNDPKVGVALMNKFISNRDINIIITAMSGVSIPLIPIAIKNKKILFLVDVTYPNITEQGDNIFRYFLTTDSEAKAMSKFMVDSLKIKKISIFYIADEAGLGAKEVLKSDFESKGGKILAEETYKKEDIDMKSSLIKIITKKPEGVWIYGFGQSYGTAIKQLREIGYKGYIFTNQGYWFKNFRDLAGPFSEGVIFTMPNFASNNVNEKGKEFIQKYKKEFGSEPGLEAVYAYDIIRMIKKAIDQNENSFEGIKKGLFSLNNFEGIMGSISIKKNGDIDVPIVISTIENNQIKILRAMND